MTASAASANLSVRHIFGVNVNVSENISFTDDETIVYVGGKTNFSRRFSFSSFGFVS
jgi:hypothetical protein